jgi:hypothetical protein
MRYSRGQNCGQSSRQATVDILFDAQDFELVGDTIKEEPTCTFKMAFSVPFSNDVLKLNYIPKQLNGYDKGNI